MAQTTVSAADGETIVLGGLMQKGRTKVSRKVPYLADIPVLGQLFQYNNIGEKRSELLIVLTPHIVRTPEDAERLKRTESARMTWCLGDVQEIHGDGGLSRNGGTPEVIYPDLTPRGNPPARSGWEAISPQGNGGGRPPGPAPHGPSRLPPLPPQPMPPGPPVQPMPQTPQGTVPPHGPAVVTPATITLPAENPLRSGDPRGNELPIPRTGS
jgi:hypothetical protein